MDQPGAQAGGEAREVRRARPSVKPKLGLLPVARRGIVVSHNYLEEPMSEAVPNPLIEPVRDASRRLVRELGFMAGGLAGTTLPPSAVHAMVEIGLRGPLLSTALCDLLRLDKSSVSRMVRKLVRAGELELVPGGRDARAKPLALTAKGQATLGAINRFAQQQVGAALGRLPPETGRLVLDGLATYADALHVGRAGRVAAAAVPVTIEAGYRPGVIGRIGEMHGRIYAQLSGLGQYFEWKVASGVVEFAPRLGNPRNGLWTAVRAGQIVGTIVIDGEDMAPNAHLRWFLVEDGLRGGGIGRRLLAEAIGFCDRLGFPEIHLTTFRSLDAARHLYETAGFRLVGEAPGQSWGKEVSEQRFVRVAARSP
jgi:DNA-binding MarR family transcriptional regulator/ribosomal protein S18 acetylase RimI-like enzyme